MSTTLRSKVEKSKRARLVEPRKDDSTTVTLRPTIGDAKDKRKVT